jgi:uncharacterized protein YggE
MKSWLLATAVAALAVLATTMLLRAQGPAQPAADAKKEKRTITTAGSATLKIKPDSARVFFGVQTIGKTVKSAREENNKLCKKVINALTALKIPDMKLKTSDINIELIQPQANNPTELPPVLGYRVTSSYTVLVQDNDAAKLSGNASRVLDTALESGANFVQQIVAFRRDDAEIKQTALKSAVEAALANAKAIAAGAKVQIRDTFAINGEPEYSFGRGQCGLTNQLIVGGIGDGETPVIVGDLEITIRVSISCLY